MRDKKIKLNLEFPESVFKIMKQRKNRYAKKEKIKDLSWKDYLIVRVLVDKKL